MRRKLIQLGTILILTLCIWGHVSEIFDHWDNTLQTGNDLEYSTVVVALIAGAVLGLVHCAAVVLRTVTPTLGNLSLLVVSFPASASPVVLVSHSPPQPLRI